MSDIEVTIVSTLLAIGADWDDLIRRAAPNVFMNPAALNAIVETEYARTHVLLAWDRSAAPKKLVGIWALEEQTMPPLGLRFLEGLPQRYAFVASPVIDPDFTDAVVPAFFAAIAADAKLPKVIRAKFLDGGLDSAAVLASGAGTNRRLMLSERTRAYFTREAGAKRSGSTRKKLRQDWNRLATQGDVDVVNDRDPIIAKAAFELFLTMEQKSWKGANGTALLSNARDAAFVRRMFANLADAGAASVALLRVDGQAIAAQVVLTAGRTAYTWKIAHDETFEKYSPGVLLVDKLTEQFLAEDSIDAIESCSPEGGFLASLWTGRRPTLDLLIEVGDRRTLAFTAVAASVKGRAIAKEMQSRFVAWRASRRTPKVQAAA